MYAVTIELNRELLQTHCAAQSYSAACEEIGKCLHLLGFSQQGGVYYADEATTVVETVMAIKALSAQVKWLKYCVQRIRLLRIEETADLSCAL